MRDLAKVEGGRMRVKRGTLQGNGRLGRSQSYKKTPVALEFAEQALIISTR